MKQIKIILPALFILHSIVSSQSPTGLIPLNDLKSGYYKTYQGGLYPNGENVRPFRHDSLGLYLSEQIKPLDSSGSVDAANGKIVLLSIGMSNTTQEFSTFMPIANGDNSKNPKLILVDGAQGGQTASIISDPSANFWSVITTRLQAANVTANQVQVCWIKEADAGPSQGFPAYANKLRDELLTVARNIKQKYPNCRLAYLSSRTYGGYATTNLNPEPYAYESGFSVKWLIEKQINGDPLLDCAGSSPVAPWLAWGPYLWADGTNPRSDGMMWLIDDFVTSDRTHPSASGVIKVAEALLNFFKTDGTAAKWFLKGGTSSAHPEEQENIPDKFLLEQNYPNPFNPETVIKFTLPKRSKVKLEIFDLLGRSVATLADDELDAGNYKYKWNASKFATSVYIYKISADDFTSSKKLMLIK